MRQMTNSERAFFYAHHNFLKGQDNLGEVAYEKIEKELSEGQLCAFSSTPDATLCYKQLEWDTAFFGIPVYRIDFTKLAEEHKYSNLAIIFADFREHLDSLHPCYYAFSEVPCEDTAVITAMTQAGWRLIETRVTYFHDGLQSFEPQARYAVRSATPEDIPELRKTAIEAVNYYDRFHADNFFSEEQSKAMLGAFVENSVKGFADEVIVPAEGPANAFATLNHLLEKSSNSDIRIAKLVLTAVSKERRGWLTKLLSEIVLKSQQNHYHVVSMTTQATNRAVLKVFYKLGFKFGKCTHILSTYKKK